MFFFIHTTSSISTYNIRCLSLFLKITWTWKCQIAALLLPKFSCSIKLSWLCHIFFFPKAIFWEKYLIISLLDSWNNVWSVFHIFFLPSLITLPELLPYDTKIIYIQFCHRNPEAAMSVFGHWLPLEQCQI